MPSVQVEEIGPLSRLNGHSQTWSENLVNCGEDPIFLGMDWLQACWESFGEGRRPLLLRAVEGGRTVGFAPLTLSSRGRVKWTKLEFMGAGPSDRCGIIAEGCREDIHRAFWEHLRERDDWDVVELRDMAQGGPTENVVQSLFPGGDQVMVPSPFVTLFPTHEEYEASLSKNMRSNIRKGVNKMNAMGATFRAMRTPEEVAEGMGWLKTLSDIRWDGMGVLSDPRMMAFVRRITRALAGRGVVFHSLEVKNEPVAIAMGLEDRDRYLYYLAGFNPELAKASPGVVLLMNIIKEAHEMGKREVDLLRGEEAYKYRFNAVDRPHLHFRTVNRGLLRKTQYSIREAPLA